MFCGVGCGSLLGCVRSPPVLSLCLLVVFRPWCQSCVSFPLGCPYRCVCVVALAVAGVVVWQLGCAGGLCGVLGSSLFGCSPFSPCGCTLPPLCGAWWFVGATQCGWCGVRPGLRRRVLAGVRLRGPRDVDWVGGRGGVCPSGVACPSLVCVPVPVIAPSPPVPRLLAFPFPSPQVVLCPRVVLPPVPCPCGRLPATLGLPSRPCRGPPLCPSTSGCAGGGVGGGGCGASGARQWNVWSHQRRVSGV